mgnify:FL=1
MYIKGEGRLAKKLNLIGTFSTLGIIVTGLMVGILVTAQVRSGRLTSRALNPLSSFAALRDTRVSLSTENELLANTVKSLSDEINVSEKDLKLTEYSSRQKVEQSDQLKASIGLMPASGEGIIVTLADSEGSSITSNAIAHAADMRDLVNLLWSNGATAIAVNDQRIVATTSIDCIVNTVMINNTRTVPPFDIRAVGDRRRLLDAVNNENFLPDIHNRIKNEGLGYKISELKRVDIPAYTSTFIVEHAK